MYSTWHVTVTKSIITCTETKPLIVHVHVHVHVREYVLVYVVSM